jgi:hypothetical protein
MRSLSMMMTYVTSLLPVPEPARSSADLPPLDRNQFPQSIPRVLMGSSRFLADVSSYSAVKIDIWALFSSQHWLHFSHSLKPVHQANKWWFVTQSVIFYPSLYHRRVCVCMCVCCDSETPCCFLHWIRSSYIKFIVKQFPKI